HSGHRRQRDSLDAAHIHQFVESGEFRRRPDCALVAENFLVGQHTGPSGQDKSSAAIYLIVDGHWITHHCNNVVPIWLCQAALSVTTPSIGHPMFFSARGHRAAVTASGARSRVLSR